VIGAVLGLALGVLLIGLLAVWIVRRRRTPAELRGDWWPRFEAEFRAYARRTASSPTRRPPDTR
jgi:hypothetical protein